MPVHLGCIEWLDEQAQAHGTERGESSALSSPAACAALAACSAARRRSGRPPPPLDAVLLVLACILGALEAGGGGGGEGERAGAGGRALPRRGPGAGGPGGMRGREEGPMNARRGGAGSLAPRSPHAPARLSLRCARAARRTQPAAVRRVRPPLGRRFPPPCPSRAASQATRDEPPYTRALRLQAGPWRRGTRPACSASTLHAARHIAPAGKPHGRAPCMWWESRVRGRPLDDLRAMPCARMRPPPPPSPARALSQLGRNARAATRAQSQLLRARVCGLERQ